MTWFHWLTDQFWWSLVYIECFHFCLNVRNKDSIQLTFISSCCLMFGTAFGLFWTSSCYLRDDRSRVSHLDSYIILSFASFLQCMNDGVLCLWYILNFCHLWYWMIICLTLKIFLPIVIFYTNCHFLYQLSDTEHTH